MSAMQIVVVARADDGSESTYEAVRNAREVVRSLAADGHVVTVGVIGEGDATWGDATTAVIASPVPGITRDLRTDAVRIHHWLRGFDWDVVFFADPAPTGYYALCARRTTAAYDGRRMCIIAQRGEQWSRDRGEAPYSTIADVDYAYMHRKSYAWADFVVCEEELPWPPCDAPPPRPSYPTELVYIGSHGPGGGLIQFCNALDRLAVGETALDRITITNPYGRCDGEHSGGYVLHRSARWPWEVTLLPELRGAAAASYAAGSGRCAVVGGTSARAADVSACLSANAFLFVSNAAGAATLIDGGDRADSVTHEGEYSAELRRYMCNGRAPRRSAIASKALGACLGRRAKSDTGNVVCRPAPLVSCIVTHYERPALAARALASLRLQTYQPIQLILVDDGSQSADAMCFLDRMEASGDVLVIRQSNQSLGAARNAGANAASGTYLCFLDDDNVAVDHQVATFVQAAQQTGADIVTSFALIEQVDSAGEVVRRSDVAYLPLGGGLASGLAWNSFGDANALIRRNTLQALSGFSVNRTAVHDWELFYRAVAAGFNFELVPEPLAIYRASASGMFNASNKIENLRLILSATRLAPVAALRDLVEVAGSTLLHDQSAWSLQCRLRERRWPTLWLELQRVVAASDGERSLLEELKRDIRGTRGGRAVDGLMS